MKRVLLVLLLQILTTDVATAEAVGWTASSVLSREGANGLDFIVSFAVTAPENSEAASFGVVRCDGDIPDGIGVVAILISVAEFPPASEFPDAQDLVQDVIAGQAVFGETLNGGLELVLTGAMLDLVNSGGEIHFLLTPNPQARTSAAGLLGALDLARLEILRASNSTE